MSQLMMIRSIRRRVCSSSSRSSSSSSFRSTSSSSSSSGSSSSSSNNGSLYYGIASILSIALYTSTYDSSHTTTCSIDSSNGSGYDTDQVITNWSATHNCHPHRVYEPKVLPSSSSSLPSLSLS